MKKNYHQVPLRSFFVPLIVSCCACIWLFSLWVQSGSWYLLPLAFITLAVGIAFARPLLENRKIIVEGKSICITQRFSRPVQLDVSRDLYQIVVRDDDIRSFRFRHGDKYFQISPMGYQDGKQLSEHIKKIITKNKVAVEIVSD